MILGKNGEPIPNKEILFTFTHNLYSHSSSKITLTTNEQGIIELGSLSGIRTVQSIIYDKSGPVYGYWNITNSTQRTSFPNKFEILQGEELEFPMITSLEKSEFNENTFSLIKYNSRGNAIKNMFSKCKYTPPKSGSPGLVKITNFKAGHYKICFKECNILASITVHEGTYWKEKAYILKKGKLIELNSSKLVSYIKIKKSKCNEKTMRDEITLRPQNTVGKVRVHVIANNFISSNDFQDFKTMKETVVNTRNTNNFTLSQLKSTYQSNKKVENKPKSIFERKRLSKTGIPIGFGSNNNFKNWRKGDEALQIPQMLLKRMKIKETSFDEQSIGLRMTYQRAKKESKTKTSGKRKTVCSSSQDMRYNTSHEIEDSEGQRIMNINPESLQHNSFLNFLKYPCTVKANLTVDDNGNINFSIPSQ